jgi:ABC-2 type transport system ATP-binding protein
LENILSISHLHKQFGALHAVKDLSVEISKGNVYGILGPNGSGKSTTLGIVLHVVNKTSGSYSWFGGGISQQDALKKVGAIIERPNFYPYMTAAQNLELVRKIKGAHQSKIDEKLELVGLLDRKNSRFSTFSLGMKQRLAIASALLNDPQILILDEPTNGLDPQGIIQIRDLIKKIAASGTTILLASHLLDEVEKVCTHVLILQKGKMVFAGPVGGIEHGACYELQAENMEQLAKVIAINPEFKNMQLHENKLILYTKTELPASEINRFLSENGIYLSHLNMRRRRLEEQFLELTKDPR